MMIVAMQNKHAMHPTPIYTMWSIQERGEVIGLGRENWTSLLFTKIHNFLTTYKQQNRHTQIKVQHTNLHNYFSQETHQGKTCLLDVVFYWSWTIVSNIRQSVQLRTHLLSAILGWATLQLRWPNSCFLALCNTTLYQSNQREVVTRFPTLMLRLQEWGN